MSSFLAEQARGQSVTGYTAIDYYEATNTVDAYSETTLDFDLGGDYDAKILLQIMDHNNNIINNQVYSAQHAGSVSVNVQFSGTPGTTYTAIGGHWAVATLSDYYSFYPYPIFYFDSFYLSSFESQGIFTPWYYSFISPGFQNIERNVPNINLGGTHDSASTTVPAVVPVRYTKVTQAYGTAEFAEALGSYSATLSLPSNSPPCQGTPFHLKVYLSKGYGATLHHHNDPRNSTDTAEDSQYRINGGSLQNEDTRLPVFDNILQRLYPDNPNKKINYVVAGYTSTTSFSVPASVLITCD